jgi:hypothetical protein
MENTNTVDVRREAVAFHESKLAAVKKQRDVILIDKRVASARVDAGDQRARMEVARLNKQDLELGRLVISLERQVRESKKWLAMAEDQAAGAAAKASTGAAFGDRLFEVVCPDGVRKVRHRAASREALQKALQPQYRVVSEIFGANEDNTGGFAASIGSDAKSNMMDALLQAHGDTLLAWLSERGIVGGDKQTVVVLPSNNRELM